jgi:hypothetical protein
MDFFPGLLCQFVELGSVLASRSSGTDQKTAQIDLVLGICHNRFMSGTRTILCLDLDAFYASVEELLHPGWRGCPILVGARPEERGVVASCS